MHHRIEAVSFEDERLISKAIAALVWHAMQNGVLHPDEKMTIIIPRMDIGGQPDKLEDSGEWELVLKKVAD